MWLVSEGNNPYSGCSRNLKERSVNHVEEGYVYKVLCQNAMKEHTGGGGGGVLFYCLGAKYIFYHFLIKRL